MKKTPLGAHEVRFKASIVPAREVLDLGTSLTSLFGLPIAIAELKADLVELKDSVRALCETTPTELLSVAQAAHRLGVSEPTVRRLIKRGDLAVERVGRSIRVRASSLVARDGSTIAHLASCARGR